MPVELSRAPTLASPLLTARTFSQVFLPTILHYSFSGTASRRRPGQGHGGCGRQEVAAELAGGNQPPRSSPAEAGGCGVSSRRRVVDAVDRRGECPPLPETCHLRSPSLAPDPLRLLRTATGPLRTICRPSALSRAHNRRLAWLRAFLAG